MSKKRKVPKPKTFEDYKAETRVRAASASARIQAACGVLEQHGQSEIAAEAREALEKWVTAIEIKMAVFLEALALELEEEIGLVRVG